MNFEIAIERARNIQNEFPERHLCGSVGLKLTGVLPPYDVGDIDLVADFEYLNKLKRENRANEKLLYSFTDHYYLECFTPHPHCLLFSHAHDLAVTVVDGLSVQDPQQMVTWKKGFNRPKDRATFEGLDGLWRRAIKNPPVKNMNVYWARHVALRLRGIEI